ncbi:hypothetical protein E8E13_001143 [Curvularia kusanoi]|uniref:Cytochrome b561 domain-containing protein n=1 Tax=Curvularia kusanoi TaxID=90978 RepID=A0A9P4TA83_CURKU|nr:hypothetical protein E8E13_001143 [Curvularia kusanoi]
MFAAGKPVWYLPLAVLFAVAVLFTFHFGYDRYFFAHTRNPDVTDQFGFLSAESVAALKDDARLHHALLGLTESIAHTSSELGQKYGLEGVADFGLALGDSMVELRKRNELEAQKRGLLEDFAKGVGNVLGGLGVNTTGGLGGILGNLGTALTNGLATPALFLGIGVGVGASTGLNITDTKNAQAQASRVASTFNATATGLNLAAQNIGSGLAGQIAPSLGQSGGLTGSIGPAAFALASGIGNATAKALNLTSQNFQPSSDGGIQAIAGNLGLGLSTPIVSNIDFQAVMKSANGGGVGASIMKQLPAIAAAAGNGLGEGARNGLGLQQTGQTPRSLGKRQDPADPLQGVDVPATVNQFTKGLSQSLLTGVDVTKLAGSLNLTGNIGDIGSNLDLPSLASGAGSGIGLGLAIGLSLRPVDAGSLIEKNGNDGGSGTALIAETFTQNLVSNLLLNSTIVQSAGSTLTKNAPQFLKDANVAKAAEGFARGSIEGISVALSSIGGIQNLISGNFSNDAMMNVPTLQPTGFNDSLNGSAVSFARGFMGEGTILVGNVLRTMGGKADKAQTPLRLRGLEVPASKAAVAPYSTIIARQAQENTSTVPLAISEATLMGAGQFGINLLTCQGIGGLASVALGAMSGQKDKSSMEGMMSGLDPRVLSSLPQGPVQFTSEGNTFRVVLKDAEISINSLPFKRFGVLTALHVVFMVISFLFTLPLYLILGVVWRLSVLAGYPVNEAKNKKWRLGLLITFAITALIGTILGIAGMGSSRHFRDAHGVFGLIALILMFPTVGFTIARLRSEALYPSPSTFAGIKAPIALLKSPDQKIYLISGFLIQLVFALGQITFINGFSTLRSISLCVVDAVLTSNAVVGLMGLLLMVQITAAGMVAIRTWLEQHIAKREKAGVQRTTILEAGNRTRKDSIATFGFGRTRSNAPAPLNLDRPALQQRATGELKGFADEKISTPFNVRKAGAEDTAAFNNPRQLNRQPSPDVQENPFLSPDKQRDLDERVYPQTADYQYTYKSAVDDNTDYYSVPVGYVPQQGTVRSGRPSSDLLDPLDSPMPATLRAGDSKQTDYMGPRRGNGSPPKTQGVTTADLFPPPPPPPMDPQMQLTAKSASSSYSRPFNEVPLFLILLTAIPLTIFLVATLAYLTFRSNPFATFRTRRHKLQSDPDTALKTPDIEHALPTVETVAQRREMRVAYQQAQGCEN